MGRRALFCVMVAATSWIVGVSPPASGAVFFAAECLMSMSFSFDPELTVFPQSGTVTFESSGSTCVGTSILTPASITDGTSSGTISCGLIATTSSGSAKLTYPPAPAGTFNPILVGNIAALQMVMLPKGATIAGSGTFSVPSLSGNCLSGVSEMTMTGVVTFSDPSLE